VMNSASWITPSTVQILGWTLVHFIWEGVALAAMLYVALAFCRTALARYSAALGTLVLMVCSPLGTSFFLAHRAESAFHVAGLPPVAGAANAALTVPATTPGSTAVLPFESPGWLTWFVLFWCTGVLVFAVRALGGWFVLQRLRREKGYQLPEGLRQRCLVLQRRLGLSRTVRYFESRHLDSAAVVGWFRPVILLPITALTGLSPQQLEAVIVHELAHIKRLDCFINLFQIAAETLLFYHPAVWWVNRCIRAERENCCDDIAVTACGDAYEYARALTMMETWRATPALVVAANGGSLKLRISRLLGFRAMTHSAPRGGLAVVGLVCAAGAVLAGSTFNRTFSHLSEFEPSALQQADQSTTPVASEPAPPVAVLVPSTEQTDTVATRANATLALTASAQTAVTTSEDQNPPEPPEPPSTEPSSTELSSTKQSYIAGLESVGLKNLKVDQIIALKVQGVTPEYVRSMRAEGLEPNVNELVGMKVQGVSPEYVRAIRATGLKPTVNDFIALRVQGVTAEYVRGIQSQGWKDVTVSQIIGMRVQGVKPGDAAAYQRLGLKDVTPDRLIALRVQGVTPGYVRAMQSAGFTNLSTHDYIAAKVQGVTPDFIQKVRSHGFTNLSLHQLIALKMANVF
jgi:beta-lactamase regulating signal transducer with metallopeptidase domain